MIKKDIRWNIPNDYRNTMSAINSGEPLTESAPNAEVTKKILELAASLSGRKDDENKWVRAGGIVFLGCSRREDCQGQEEDKVNIRETTQQAFTQTNEYNGMKLRLHERLLDILDLSLIDSLDKATLQREIRKAVEYLFSQGEFTFPLNAREKEHLYREVQDEVLGLGPIEPFMHDPTVTDVLVNTYKQIYVERSGKLHLTGARFKDDTHLKKIIDRIVSAVGRRIDESCPMVDARLADGSRVNAIVPPLAIDGPILSIRRFSADPLEMEDLITLGTVSPEIAEFLQRYRESEAQRAHIGRYRDRERRRSSTCCRASSRTTSASSPLKIRRSFSSSRSMWCAWRRDPPTSRARVRSPSGTS